MGCPECSRKRYKEKIIKRGKRTFMVRECLGCNTQYEIMEVRKSKVTNTWIEKEATDDK